MPKKNFNPETTPIYLPFATLEDIAEELDKRPNAWTIMVFKNDKGEQVLHHSDHIPKIELAKCLSSFTDLLLDEIVILSQRIREERDQQDEDSGDD